jgi:hypothetical protein
MIKAGDILTIKFDIIDINGNLMFVKGQKVTVNDVWIVEGHWSNLCPDIWYPDKLMGVMLEDGNCSYVPDCFVELSKI